MNVGADGEISGAATVTLSGNAKKAAGSVETQLKALGNYAGTR